jgi:hypothetical protein
LRERLFCWTKRRVLVFTGRFNRCLGCLTHSLSGVEDISTIENEITVLPRNVQNRLPSDVASYPRRKKYLAKLPREDRSVVTFTSQTFI